MGKVMNASVETSRYGEGVPLEIEKFAAWVKSRKPPSILGINGGKK